MKTKFLKSLKSKSLQTLILICTFFTVVQIIIYFISGKSNFLNGILSWDAIHYEWIKENGYKGFRTVFFPGFPLLWRALNLNVYSISILNGLLFISSFCGLTFQMDNKITLKVFAFIIPLSFFFFIPYSESLFFFGATLLLLGYIKKFDHLKIAGIIICSLTRPVSLFIIPAFGLIEVFLPIINKQKINWKFVFFGIGSFAICYLGIITSNYLTENDPFAFYNNQKIWPNELSLIELPLRSWGSGLAAKIDGTAMFTGTFLIYWNIKYLKLIQANKPKYFHATLISIVFVGLSLLSVLLYRSGSLFSLGRFLFCSPFILILIANLLYEKDKILLKRVLILLLTCTLYWFLFNSWVHIQTFLKFGIASLYILLIYLNINSNLKTQIGFIYYIILLITNSILLIWFFEVFLAYEWIG